MKTRVCLFIIVLALLSSCKKSASGGDGNNGLVNSWQLVKVNATVGANSFVETPAGDSAVLLKFNADNAYSSFLNNQAVCQGSFSLSADTSQPGWQLIEMNNFVQTGLFQVWKEYEDTGSGPWILVDDKMALNISHDTLYMEPSFISFGGWSEYIFLKQ
jgi:hypothetical protein